MLDALCYSGVQLELTDLFESGDDLHVVSAWAEGGELFERFAELSRCLNFKISAFVPNPRLTVSMPTFEDDILLPNII